MSESIASIKKQLWAKMQKKSYRDNFVAAQLSTSTAAQVQTIRESQEMTQKELARLTGMTQARISLIENPSYDNLNVSTLKRIASAFDVALIVRFVPFSQLTEWVSQLSPEKLACTKFADDSLSPAMAVASGSASTLTVRKPSEQGTPGNTQRLLGGYGNQMTTLPELVSG